VLIDEDPHVRALASETLRASGHIVTEIEGVHAMIDWLDQHGRANAAQRIDVIIVDLPEGAGTIGFETLRARLPTVPMLCTGTFDDRVAARGGTAKLAFLAKPYRAQALAERLSALLRGSGTHGSGAQGS
jgi:DNA-binding response OmpR family regulator